MIPTIKEILVSARNLIAATGWCQKNYAMLNGKVHYNFILGEQADSYCLVGAILRVTSKMWYADGQKEEQSVYNRLAHQAGHAVVGNNVIPADWNDQKGEADHMIDAFIAQLKERNLPRAEAKNEINAYRKYVQSLNLPPALTVEKVLQAIDETILRL